MSHNFRTALSGFRKEDVVRYLEYMNTKHQNQVNQLNTEIDELRSRLEEGAAAFPSPEIAQEYRGLEEENRLLREQKESLEARCAQLEAQLAQQPEAAPPAVAQDLETYRMVERMQQEAKEQTELLYFQANHILTEATKRVDTAASDITELTDKTMRQVTQLQVAISASKQALQEAAAILATLRPNR